MLVDSTEQLFPLASNLHVTFHPLATKSLDSPDTNGPASQAQARTDEPSA
jgi:hypothetical protein